MTTRDHVMNPTSATLFDVSVVVCAYTLERWADIERAVQSLVDQSVPPAEIVLVTDYNEELLARARARWPQASGDRVTVVHNAATKGLSGARNTGIAASHGDVVAFLDDDAAADPQWLAKLLEAYAEPGVIGVGGGVVPDWQAPRPAWMPEEFLWVVGCSYRGLPTSRAAVRNAIGANMSFRRDVLDSVGGFDARMGRIGKDAAGCEETELSIRALASANEARILLEPAASCRHSVTADRVTRAYFRKRCWAEGRSKALVSRLAGSGAALASERTYVARTLPMAVLRGLREAASGDRGGAARAAAVVEGLAVTSVSYALTRARGQRLDATS